MFGEQIMKKIILILLMLLLVCSVVIISCDNDNKTENDNKTDNTNENNSTKKMTPEEIGDEIAETYVNSIKKLGTLVKGHPAPEEVKEDFEKLKEETIKKMVELGKAREKLDQSGKNSINMSLYTKMGKVQELSEYPIFQKAVQHYNSVDPDFSAELSKFNIITQYAQFELLKKQEPEEAKRLGID